MKSQPTQPQFSEAEFTEWKEHPVTKAFMKWAADSRTAIMDTWANGGYKDSDGFVAAQMNTDAMARAQVLAAIQEITLEDIVEKQDA